MALATGACAVPPRGVAAVVAAPVAVRIVAKVTAPDAAQVAAVG